MATYTATGNEDIVVKETIRQEDIDLSGYITEYQYLKNSLQNLPEFKTVADQETLDYWNDTFAPNYEIDKAQLDERTALLYSLISPIYDASLLPSKYNNEYVQLENYVNNL